MSREIVFLFTVQPGHINLLKEMSVGWEESHTDPTHPGAPAIKRFRTYGNSDLEGDLAEILELPPLDENEDEEEEEKTEEEKKQEAEQRQAQEDRMYCMHRETQFALQILLMFGKIEPGTYACRNAYFTQGNTTLLSEEKLQQGLSRAKEHPEWLEMIQVSMQKKENGVIDWHWADATKG